MAHKGWDRFTPKCDTVKEMYCRVCGQLMEVTRGVNGPTSSIEAMGKVSRLHDVFRCKDSERDWHKQALRLSQDAENTPSKRLEIIYLEEVEEILLHRKPTK